MVYQDGSVLLTHGGTEMGQGLHTKMIQVASQVKIKEMFYQKFSIAPRKSDFKNCEMIENNIIAIKTMKFMKIVFLSIFIHYLFIPFYSTNYLGEEWCSFTSLIFQKKVYLKVNQTEKV